MKLYALIAAGINPNDEKAYIYSREYELSDFSFFYRNSIKETFKFVCRESVGILDKGTRHTVKHEGDKQQEFYVHIQVSYKHKLAFFAFCDSSYPKRVAFKCLGEFMTQFESKVGEIWMKYIKDEKPEMGLATIMKSYTDPTKADTLTAAQKNADDIQVILHDNIKTLLERQGNLDMLVEKSKDLSTQSKMFYKNTKKMDKKCCIIF